MNSPIVVQGGPAINASNFNENNTNNLADDHEDDLVVVRETSHSSPFLNVNKNQRQEVSEL